MGQILAVIIASLIGVAVAYDAKDRDMNPIGWGLLVSLFMIVGLPLYFIMRKPKKFLD